jgi:hypothetical protein
MARFQGVNKGIFTNDMFQMLTMFNNNAGNEYVSWELVSGVLSLVSRHKTEVSENGVQISVVTQDSYNGGVTDFSWYMNGIDQANNGNIFNINTLNSYKDYGGTVITYDGKYYGSAKFFVARGEPERADITVIPWDGSTSTGFIRGNGTISNPFLIGTGSELAHLASRVNAGTTFAGQYFQLANSIDLNGRDWTPIGTNAISFRGNFDGAGHTISNAVITTKAANTAGVGSYGIFGSITQTANNTAEIKNLVVSNVAIRLGQTAATFTANSGYHAGFIVGTIHRNAKVTNSIVKDSRMSTVRKFNNGSNSRSFPRRNSRKCRK